MAHGFCSQRIRNGSRNHNGFLDSLIGLTSQGTREEEEEEERGVQGGMKKARDTETETEAEGETETERY